MSLQRTGQPIEAQIDRPIQGGPQRLYFVIRQTRGPWSNTAEVVDVAFNAAMAEDLAMTHKAVHPSALFCVAKLICEARSVKKPVEIVRIENERGN